MKFEKVCSCNPWNVLGEISSITTTWKYWMPNAHQCCKGILKDVCVFKMHALSLEELFCYMARAIQW